MSEPDHVARVLTDDQVRLAAVEAKLDQIVDMLSELMPIEERRTLADGSIGRFKRYPGGGVQQIVEWHD